MYQIRIRMGTLGRVGIPQLFREQLRIEDGTPLILTVDGDTIVIRRQSTHCLICSRLLPEDSTAKVCGTCFEKAIKEN